MANKDLLIVDDDTLVCESLKEMLLLEGFTVDAVMNGQDALGTIQNHQYQVILSDIQMSGLDGIELLKELNDIDTFEDLKHYQELEQFYR